MMSIATKANPLCRKKTLYEKTTTTMITFTRANLFARKKIEKRKKKIEETMTTTIIRTKPKKRRKKLQ